MSKLVSFIHDLFSFSLTGYLILFLIENISPGFVSNSFNLNYLLYLVLITGIISAFDQHPTPSETQTTTTDYLMAIGLSILSGLIIFLKIELEFPLRLTISLLSLFLILLMSLLLITPEKTSIPQPKTKPNFSLIKYLPLIGIFILIAILGKLNTIYLQKQKNKSLPDPNLIVKVFSPAGSQSTAESLVSTLISSGFEKTFSGINQNLDFNHPIILFSPIDYPQAKLIIDSVKSTYPTIEAVPPFESEEGTVTILLPNQ